MDSDETNRDSTEGTENSVNRARDNAFDWLKGDQVNIRRSADQAFSITQVLDLPKAQRELMLEINKSEPITLAELARKLERNPVELEIQVKQLVVQNWLQVRENEFGEWVYRVKLSRRSNRLLPPGIWQVLDNQWQIPFFRLFSDAALEDFSRRFQLEYHTEGTVLFENGDWGERMYIVDSGQVELTVRNQQGESFVLQTAKSGDIFGEMAVILGERRPYTARIIEEARIWTLDKTSLDYLLSQHPDVGLAIRHEFARQMKPVSKAVQAQTQHNPIVVVGENGNELAHALACQTSDQVVLIDLIGKRPEPRINLRYIDGSVMRSKSIADTINAHIKQQDWVVVASFPQMTDQLMRVIGLAKVVIDLSGNGAPWLHAASRHYWSVSLNFPLHLARLARKLCGRTRGLVLSGGAARTMAHLGVLDVLHRADLQFDVIASCGYGALWSVLYAAGWSPDKMIDLAANRMSKLQPFGGWLSLRSTARPGLFDIRAVRGFIRETVGGLEFSDLETPCHLITSDLVTGEVVWMNEDSLFNALSACVATPGLVTPIEYQDRLLIDALLTNPLPADAVAAEGADIILTSSVIPVPSARLEKGRKNRDQDLVTSWIGVCDVVAHERSLDHLNLIDLMVSPDIAGFSDIDFEHADLLIEKGRQAAQDALPRIQSILTSQLL
ncbi:MAG: cyclic nucleotide-binding domain-containing protein [Anaerolineae bacterium]|nr:cyclic nucleotide-binding domain-containing protein [Anaerolineae bacterium]